MQREKPPILILTRHRCFHGPLSRSLARMRLLICLLSECASTVTHLRLKRRNNFPIRTAAACCITQQKSPRLSTTALSVFSTPRREAGTRPSLISTMSKCVRYAAHTPLLPLPLPGPQSFPPIPCVTCPTDPRSHFPRLSPPHSDAAPNIVRFYSCVSPGAIPLGITRTHRARGDFACE